MSICCPVCRAENSAGTTCRRCKADLALLLTLEEERAQRLALVREAIERQEFDEALEQIEVIKGLRIDDDVRQLRACVFLLAGDFESALAEYEGIVQADS